MRNADAEDRRRCKKFIRSSFFLRKILSRSSKTEPGFLVICRKAKDSPGYPAAERRIFMALKRNEKRKSGLRLPALLLLAGLVSASLAGCGGKERKEGAMGRYVEEELAVIADAEQAAGLFLTEKGEPVFYAVHDDGKTVERCVFSKDEGTLVRTPAAWAEGMGISWIFPKPRTGRSASPRQIPTAGRRSSG